MNLLGNQYLILNIYQIKSKNSKRNMKRKIKIKQKQIQKTVALKKSKKIKNRKTILVKKEKEIKKILKKIIAIDIEKKDY